MKKILALFLVAVTLCLMLSSCGSSKKELVGTWKPREYDFGDDYVLVFNSDGTGTYFGDAIVWTIKGGKLSIAFEDTEDMELEFKVKGDEFSFIDSTGEEVFWDRVK